MHRYTLLAGLLLLVAGCGSDSGTGEGAADSTFASVQSGADAMADEPAQSAAATVIALDSDGLRLVDQSTGSTRALEFGSEEDVVVAAITNLRGAPSETGVNTECGAGPLGFASWADGLSLSFEDGRFSGWGVNGRVEGAQQNTTMAGIGIGSTRAQLEEVYDIRTGETSLGTEFAAGGIHGVLEGTSSESEISNIWSGTTCIFR